MSFYCVLNIQQFLILLKCYLLFRCLLTKGRLVMPRHLMMLWTSKRSPTCCQNTVTIWEAMRWRASTFQCGSTIKGISPPQNENCYNLSILKLFQTCINFYPLWKIKEDILKNDGNQTALVPTSCIYRLAQIFSKIYIFSNRLKNHLMQG